VGGHAAVHDTEKYQRILKKVLEVLEERRAKATTQKHPEESAPNDEVGNPFFGNVAVAQARESANNENSNDECRDIGKAIPSQTEVASEAEQKRA
jgi:hypothetical protein